ncbi:MAG TPA: hypothetical protein VN893_19165, partial [Bryobacteraceae bacterium]|nr:hypothetical protein [Bryobacteraceae bacterium]
RKVAAATGIITTVAAGSVNQGDPFYFGYTSPQSIAVDGAGNLYITFVVSEGHHSPTTMYLSEVAAGTGSTTTVDVPTVGYWSFLAAGSGKLYFGTGGEIQELTVATGVVTTVAGDDMVSLSSGEGGPAIEAQIPFPSSVAVDGFGNLYIVSSDNRVHKVAAATGIITTVAGNGIEGYSGDGGPATSAELSESDGVAVDGTGNIYIADSDNQAIRKVTAATGVITTVAGNGTGLAGYSGDGGPATSAQLWGPGGVALDGSGNIYIADTGNHAIRRVAASTGIITTVAGTGNFEPDAMALDGSGNLYFVDTLHPFLIKVAAATGITIVAGNGIYGYSGDGGPATSAQLWGPGGVAVDGSGNLYIADGDNVRVRKVAASTGIITTVAGNGTAGYSGDGGPAASAELNNPADVAVDGAGNVYVADSGNGLIRMLVPVATRAVLSITSTSAGEFARGQSGASYSMVVSNNANAGPTSGTVTVTETPPAGMTLVSMAGAGWTCSGASCTRSDFLSPGASYPAITVTLDVAAGAPSQAMNEAIVSGGGSTVSSAADLTTIVNLPEAAKLVSPANGGGGVLVAPTLVWEASADAASYDVYFGASSTPPLVMNTAGTSYAPGPLDPETTYYWQVVARNGVGSASFGVWSFTTGVAPIGSRFVPVAPCRVADTRRAGGPFGGPSMTARSMRSFAIPSSGCGIPAGAQAYSLNVTVAPSGPLGFLTLWPAGQAQPEVSTLNSPDGIVVANAAIVPAGAGGAVNLFVTGQTDVILDINGYFGSTGGASGSSFYTATPCRVADTRGPSGQFGGPSMVADQVRDFPIPQGACGIPAAATAYSLNVTAVPGTDFLGYLTAFPTGASRPFVSTLNSWTGEVVANAALVPAGANDSVSVFVTDPANVILDINGYFGRPGDTGALSFYPVTPCRVADTRGT